jgi:hypothetical protein
MPIVWRCCWVPRAIPASIKLDGVTGDLKLGRDRVFDRQLPVSLIGEGE